MSESDADLHKVHKPDADSLDIIKFQLRELNKNVGTLLDRLNAFAQIHYDQRTQYLVDKEKLDGRLLDGTRLMTETAHKVELLEQRCDSRAHETNVRLETKTKEIEAKIAPEAMDKIYIRRDMVKWIGFGIVLAGGGAGATAHLVVRALTGH